MTWFSIVFLTVLWLFVGSVFMLAVNDRMPGGVTEGEFVKGMLIWPWIALSFAWDLLRLLLLGVQ